LADLTGLGAVPADLSRCILRIAQEAERLGYAAVWTYERLETLSFVAARTERVRLGTSVIDALLHPPVVLACRFATLDQFSGGRVIAGPGQGWMPQEFETANVPMDRIGRRPWPVSSARPPEAAQMMPSRRSRTWRAVSPEKPGSIRTKCRCFSGTWLAPKRTPWSHSCSRNRTW
jgi:hypothetical protein